jgi:hypothetical protein
MPGQHHMLLTGLNLLGWHNVDLLPCMLNKIQGNRHMNYLRIYNSIINYAKEFPAEGYTEQHHIIPKCLGGSDDSSNLISLSPRQHYVCHWLLAKHYNIKKLWGAFAMMTVASSRHQRIKNSRLFERARLARSKAATGNGNGMFGKPSACKKHSQETIEKIRLSKLGKKRTAFNRSPASEETKKKISLSKLGKSTVKKGIPANKLQCPHCNKIVGGEGNFNRWHSDNCTQKLI